MYGTVSKNNSKFYFNDNNEFHREDGPAIEYASGRKDWYLNGKLHRIDGPAVEGTNGPKYWYLNDILHNLDGPAVEKSNGYKKYYIDGFDISYISYIIMLYKY